MADMLLNLGCADLPLSGYINVDIAPPADVVHDLNESWPWADGEVDGIQAHDIFEHLKSPVHSMNEAYRVLRHGGWLDIIVPTTDGRGAWQDPGHVSFWNRNSFFYYEHENLHNRRFSAQNGVKCAFEIASESMNWDADRIAKLHIRLVAVKREPTIDVMFLACNRLEYTRAALEALKANTEWALVNKFVIYDDGSSDGTSEYLAAEAPKLKAELRRSQFGTPILAFNDFALRSDADLLVKIDNDTMMPPRWLGVCAWLMGNRKELDVLGLEARGIKAELPFRYERDKSVGGIFVTRRRLFAQSQPTPIGAYFGWQHWQEEHGLLCGWIRPSLNVFLLDRLPFEPWASLGRQYEAKGWQRPWARYTEADAPMWAWWKRANG